MASDSDRVGCSTERRVARKRVGTLPAPPPTEVRERLSEQSAFTEGRRPLTVIPQRSQTCARRELGETKGLPSESDLSSCDALLSSDCESHEQSRGLPGDQHTRGQPGEATLVFLPRLGPARLRQAWAGGTFPWNSFSGLMSDCRQFKSEPRLPIRVVKEGTWVTGWGTDRVPHPENAAAWPRAPRPGGRGSASQVVASAGTQKLRSLLSFPSRPFLSRPPSLLPSSLPFSLFSVSF